MISTIKQFREGVYHLRLDEEGVIKLRQIVRAKGTGDSLDIFCEVIKGGITLLYDIWCGDNLQKEIGGE